MIASALVLQGGPARLASGEAGLARALRLALHDDGGLVSRSPIQQADLVETLAQLRAVYLAARRDVRTGSARPGRRRCGIAGGDPGRRGAVQLAGRQHGRSPPGGGRAGLGRRRGQAAAAGARLGLSAAAGAHDGAGVRCRAAPPGRALAGGAASTLAFELSDGAHRLIVNCGGGGEAADALPPGLAHALRTTAAHSTLTLGDRNSTAIHDDGTLGKGVIEVEASRDDTGGAPRAEASHDGYARRFGLIHERRLALSADGRQLSGEDRLYPAAKRRRRADVIPVAVRFHLHPDVEAVTTADGQGALLRLPGGGVWQFRCRGGRLEVEDSVWVDGAARPRATLMLAIASETPADGMTISWELARAR